MKAAIFIYEVFKKFPFLLIANTVLLVAVTLFGTCSLLAISPIVDLFIYPDLQGVSPLTAKAIDILKFFGLPVTLGVWLIVFVAFITLSSIFQIFARKKLNSIIHDLHRFQSLQII